MDVNNAHSPFVAGIQYPDFEPRIKPFISAEKAAKIGTCLGFIDCYAKMHEAKQVEAVLDVLSDTLNEIFDWEQESTDERN